MGDWFVPVAHAPLVVVFNKCQLAGPFSKYCQLIFNSVQSGSGCKTYDSTTVAKRVNGDFTPLSARHQGSTICAGGSDLCHSKGRDKRGAKHRHCEDVEYSTGEFCFWVSRKMGDNNKDIGKVCKHK